MLLAMQGGMNGFNGKGERLFFGGHQFRVTGYGKAKGGSIPRSMPYMAPALMGGGGCGKGGGKFMGGGMDMGMGGMGGGMGCMGGSGA